MAPISPKENRTNPSLKCGALVLGVLLAWALGLLIYTAVKLDRQSDELREIRDISDKLLNQ